jgi:site-specific DNA recombinase
LIHRDADLVRSILSRSEAIDAGGDEHLNAEIDSHKSKIQALANKINELEEMAGHGTAEDRRRRITRVNAATSERANLQLELTRLEKSLGGAASVITPEEVSQILCDFDVLLEDAANGKLGADVVYKAFAIFRTLIGGRIMVHVERRPGRTRTNVRGVFRPHLLKAVRAEAQMNNVADDRLPEPVEVWLREPPRLDLLAEPVHRLVDIDRLSLRGAAAKLCEEGWNVNSGNVWYSHRRWYEMRGLPVPKRPYNNGRPRKAS